MHKDAFAAGINLRRILQEKLDFWGKKRARKEERKEVRKKGKRKERGGKVLVWLGRGRLLLDSCKAEMEMGQWVMSHCQWNPINCPVIGNRVAYSNGCSDDFAASTDRPIAKTFQLHGA